jgi:hypothetical protein
MLRVFQVGLAARCMLVGLVAVHSFCWVTYYLSNTIIYPAAVDGWLLQQMIISALLLAACFVMLWLCSEINESFGDHAQFFSSVQVFVDEEVGALQRRQQRVSAFRDRSGSSKYNPLALEEVQGVITDVAFALHHESAPLQIFGVEVTKRVSLVLCGVAALTVVCIVVAVHTMSRDVHRWISLDSM